MSSVENYSETQEKYLENEKKKLFDRIETAIQKLKTTDSDEFSQYLSDFNKCFEDLNTFIDVYKLNESELNILYDYLNEKNKIIDKKREYLIIKAIENGLKSESSAALASNLLYSRKDNLINIYCANFLRDSSPNTYDMVALYEAPTSVSAVFSAFIGKESRKGILFFKDRFYYNGLYEIYYCDIKHIEYSATSLKLYKDKNTCISLNGISYGETSVIPKIFKQIYELNDDKIEITFKDKAKILGVKVANTVANAVLSELENSANRLEQDVKQAERKAQRIANNEKNYSSEQREKAESILNSGASESVNMYKGTLGSIKDGINQEKDDWGKPQ